LRALLFNEFHLLAIILPYVDMTEETISQEPVKFQDLEASLKESKEPEKKLELVIHFMETALAQQGTPHFKDFWEAKKMCLDLFREHINPIARIHLWARYSELSREARKLKELFDEESAFAVEQIEMALHAIEAEVAKIPELVGSYPQFQFRIPARQLHHNEAQYKELQTELDLMNAYASKITALRKELMKTDMRIRDKNHFFARLSTLGDAVFPKRKELITKVSELFRTDIDAFIANTFTGELKTAELFHVKDEIKALQSAAKELTLNAETFAASREGLSQCWDTVSRLIESKKKEEVEQRVEFRQHRDEILAKLSDITKRHEEKKLDDQGALAELDLISMQMRKMVLGRHEIDILREKLTEVRKVFLAKQQIEVNAARDAIRQKEEARKAALEAAETGIEQAIATAAQKEPGVLQGIYEELADTISDLSCYRAEKIELERKLHRFRDLILEMKEQKIQNLAADDKEKLSHLKQFLSELTEQRDDVKARLENLRRQKGSSQLNFAQALEANDSIDQERARLERIETNIEEIEQQISDLEE